MNPNFTRWKDLNLGDTFKKDPSHTQYFKKTKVGRKIIAQPMVGGFTFLTPPGMNRNAIVYPFTPNE